jgi:hypothetical protein
MPDARSAVPGDAGFARPADGGTRVDLPIAPPTIVEPAPRSKRHACIVYERAVRLRQAQCSHADLQGYNDLSEFNDNCPPVDFARGSTATIDGLLQCAKQWPDFSCIALARGFGPSCAPLGTYADAVKCRFDAQCEHGNCGTLVSQPTGGYCAVCAPWVPEHGDCSLNACTSGYQCSNNVCVPWPDWKPLSEGEPCEIEPQCPLDLWCMDRGDGLRCLAPSKEGQACGVHFGQHDCDQGLRCNSDLICQKLPPAGQPCVVPADKNRAVADLPLCASDAYCDAAGQCRSLPELGEPCVLPPGDVVERCAAGLRCIDGTCKLPLGLGEPCKQGTGLPPYGVEPGPCRDELSCSCDINPCQGLGLCVQLLPEGAACGAANTKCAANTTCVHGVCTADDAPDTRPDCEW